MQAHSLLKRFLTGTFLFFIFATVVHTTSAQSPTPMRKEGINLTLSPVFMNVMVEAGKTTKRTFKVTNNNNFVENYQIVVLKYIPDNKGSIIPADFNKQDDTVRWFTFSKTAISVGPRSTETVTFELSPPADAFLGYYFGIAIERAKEEFLPTDTTNVVGAATIPVLLEVRRQIGKEMVGAEGDPTKYKTAEVASFRTTSPWYEYVPAEFEIAFKNTGKIHLVPFGEIFIGQGKNKELAAVSVNEGSSNTLPGSQRVYKVAWNDGFIVREPVKENGSVKQDAKGAIVYKTNVYWDKLTQFRIGRYTANLVLVYNNGQFDVPLEQQISFWILPWKIILVATLIIVLVILGLRNLIVGVFRS